MKRIFRPLIDSLHATYERQKFYKAPRSRSKIQRKYANVDLTKDFEVRTAKREKEKQQKLEELYEKHDQRALEMKDVISSAIQETPQGQIKAESAENAEEKALMKQMENDAYRAMMDQMKEDRDKLIQHFDKDTDLQQKILITGVKKICVLGMIKYHQIRQNLFEEVSLHPELMKNLEILHYHVENNFPIEKEMVFKLVPELFVHEINKLDARDQLKFKKPRISYTRADGEALEVDAKMAQLRASESDRLFEKSMQMEMYLLEQTSDVYKFYYDKLRDEVLNGGHIGLQEYLMELEVMDSDKMKDWERRLWSEIQELRLIQDDIKALQLHLEEKDSELIIPEWIMDPQLREEAMQLLKYAEKYETIDIRDTVLLPIPQNRGPDFEERLRESMDVDAMIEESNRELRDYANKRIPLPAKSLSEKDNDLLKKVSLIAQAVKVDEPPLIAPDINEMWITEEQFRKDLPSEKRILVDEMYKILQFNNMDPETYNIQFWADYFSIPASAVRNIVNYVAFPVVDINTKQVKDVLYFIDTELQTKRRELLMEDLDRETYLKFLENDYQKRMVELYGDEAGYFGKIERGEESGLIEDNSSTAQPRMILDANKMEEIVNDKKVLEDLDKEIKQITDSQSNEWSKTKNLKSDVHSTV